MDFSHLKVSQIQQALERSVDSARYWQSPDGEDVLAGLPVVARALSPVAEQFIASPRLQWCRQPRQVEQWTIDWRHADDPAPLPRSPAKTLREWARKERAEEMTAARERPSDPTANVSGTWWSIPHGVLQTVGQLPAGLNLVEDSLGWEHAITIPGAETATVIAGWDPDSTIWLADVAREGTGLRQQWQRDSSRDSWIPAKQDGARD